MSNKMHLSLRIIEQCILQGEKCLLFTQFTGTLDIFENILNETNIQISPSKKRPLYEDIVCHHQYINFY